ncbi:MAG TPA: ATP-binding protein [Turneriella sp.]|nr:ATP-binding protein [Turneriella sp.]
MRFFVGIVDTIIDTGTGFTRDEKTRKLVRILNWALTIGVLIAAVQAIAFFRFDFNGPTFGSLFFIVGCFLCLLLQYLGFIRLAPVLFIFIAVAVIAYQHLFFGFKAGFWLILLNLTQATFALFPFLKIRYHFILAGFYVTSLIVLVMLTMSQPPLYNGVTQELSDTYFRVNLIRSSILFVLLAYYLVYESLRSEKEVKFTAQKAMEAAEAKSFFLSNISHELRTPMNAIKGFSDILLDATNSITDEKQRLEFRTRLQQIEISAANLMTIINDMLDFTRIEMRTISLHKKDFDLFRLCENIMQTAQFYGHKNTGIKTELFFAPRLPRFVYGDSTRVSQILINLLSNAMKFTHQGTIALRVMLSEQRDNGYTICFEIEDTGIGIPSEKLTRMFERFSPVSRETAMRYGGTGLGLAISKQLVELQGGEISVMSSPGVGTLFLVNLPFEKARENYSKPAAGKYDLQQKRILVAEDNEVNQLLVKTLLESWNAEVTIVDNGLKALGSVTKRDYDLILMDLQMPFIDGFEATEQIRALENKEKKITPIIALTADVLSETRQKVFAVGMNNIVTKPINQAELFAAISQVLMTDLPKDI